MVRKFHGFLRETCGHVAIMFGVTLLPMSLLVGAALDYSRASEREISLQKAVDATALILCQAPANSTVADLRSRAQTNLTANLANDAVTITAFQANSTPRSISLTAQLSYKTSFMQLAKVTSIDVTATAGCSASETYFEIALVLDTTGSMALSGKMIAAKAAATSFVNYMYSDGAMPGHVRMSLVPFAASVAIPTAYRSATWLDTTGKSPIHWQYITNPVSNATNPTTNFTSRLSIYSRLAGAVATWDWDGCVEAPPYPYNVNDDPVSIATPSSLIVPMFAPDELSSSYFSRNSYLADGTGSGSGGTCRTDDTAYKRLTQACKYQARQFPDVTSPGPGWHCTARPFSILGTNQATLLTEIAALTPAGSTNVHEGFMWGWRSISPTSVFSGEANAPVSYAQTVPRDGQPVYKKVVVLMTDGTNQWLSNPYITLGSQYSAYGYFKSADGTDAANSNSRFVTGRRNLRSDDDGRVAIDELLAVACTNAKAKNVIVYTVGFSTPTDPIDDQGLDLLKNCSSGEGYNFVANDATSLTSAFDRISKSIGALRLTK
jgi:Flp pilus assembly protein TadG